MRNMPYIRHFDRYSPMDVDYFPGIWLRDVAYNK